MDLGQSHSVPCVSTIPSTYIHVSQTITSRHAELNRCVDVAAICIQLAANFRKRLARQLTHHIGTISTILSIVYPRHGSHLCHNTWRSTATPTGSQIDTISTHMHPLPAGIWSVVRRWWMQIDWHTCNLIGDLKIKITNVLGPRNTGRQLQRAAHKRWSQRAGLLERDYSTLTFAPGATQLGELL